MKTDALSFAKSLKSREHFPSIVWIYGPEGYLQRQVIKALAQQYGSKVSLREYPGRAFSGWAQLEAQSLTPDLFSRAVAQMWVIKDVESWKDLEALQERPLLSKEAWVTEPLYCFLSKDLDLRKKEVKKFRAWGTLVEAAAVGEDHRQVWIQHFEKKMALKNDFAPLDATTKAELASMEPWSLDRLEREFEKLGCGWASSESDFYTRATMDAMIEALFNGSLKESLLLIQSLSQDPSRYLPFLGLLAWHLRKKRTAHEMEQALLRLDQALKLSSLPSQHLWQGFVLQVKALHSFTRGESEGLLGL